MDMKQRERCVKACMMMIMIKLVRDKEYYIV